MKGVLTRVPYKLTYADDHFMHPLVFSVDAGMYPRCVNARFLTVGFLVTSV